MRKYETEMGLHSLNDWKLLVQQSDFGRLEAMSQESDMDFHIYMVASKPRVTIDPASLALKGQEITGIFRVADRGELVEVPFSTVSYLGDNVRLECPYPHSVLVAFGPDSDEPILWAKASLLLNQMKGAAVFHKDLGSLTDLEVLYVGQAYGEDGTRYAPERLKSHSTLQSIYSEIMNNEPDREVWLFLVSFQKPNPRVRVGSKVESRHNGSG
jgi:hypothetical protein